MSVQGQAVWITGGGSGLGAAMAMEYAKRGALVAVSGRREDRLVEVAERIEATGAQALAVPCDVNEDADLESAVARVVDRFGKLDVAVANAGFGVAGRIADLDRSDWQRQYEVNVISLAMTAKFAMPALLESGGRIGLVGSVAAWTPFPKNGAYQSSKAAVLSIGRTLSAELAGTGVSCTTIQPGFVESEIGRVDNAGKFDPNRKDKRPANLLWKTEDAARVMVDAIDRRKIEYTFTAHGKLAVTLARHAPWLVQAIATRAKV